MFAWVAPGGTFRPAQIHLLALPGAVETRVLPEDSMFQATHILMHYMRPAIVHGYGGADSLPALAKFGWATLGASLLGTCSCFPQWCKKDSGDSVRLAPGCDVSFRVAPAPLSLSEEVYLMGLNMCDIFIDCPRPDHRPLYGFFEGKVSR